MVRVQCPILKNDTLFSFENTENRVRTECSEITHCLHGIWVKMYNGDLQFVTGPLQVILDTRLGFVLYIVSPVYKDPKEGSFFRQCKGTPYSIWKINVLRFDFYFYEDLLFSPYPSWIPETYSNFCSVTKFSITLKE